MTPVKLARKNEVSLLVLSRLRLVQTSRKSIPLTLQKQLLEYFFKETLL